MFIRGKNPSYDKEENLLVSAIVRFIPAGDGSQSTIFLTNGDSVVLNMSNRAVRFAIKKAFKEASEETGEDQG
jgi:hypothetical protein